jgi:predicted O-methyltransferase YrrM
MVTQPISLNDALDSIAASFELNADDLIEYAAQDPWGGYHDKYDDGFPGGSIWRVEGQVLYALVRALRPRRVLEIGTYWGGSATHILQALHDNEGDGSLTCVDLNTGVGSMIPANLRSRVTILQGDLYQWLPAQIKVGETFDLIWEDSQHSVETTEAAWRAAWSLLTPGGIMACHDAEHLHVPSNTGVGALVREGIARAGFFAATPPAKTYLIAPSDCGLAVWRKLPAQTDDYVPPEDKRKNDAPTDDAPVANEGAQKIPSIGDLLAKQDLSSLTIAELKDFAGQRNIPLEGARTKGAIIAAIEAVTG